MRIYIGKGDAWGIGIEFYPGDPALVFSFLCWYLIIERKYDEQ